MKNTISILGCGWLGTPLGISLIKEGFFINGSTRSLEKFNELNSLKINPFLINISNHNTTISSFLDSEILIIAVTSKSIVDFENLIGQIEKSNIRKVIFISSSSVYNNSNSVVTEETETNDTLISTIEKLYISNSNFKSTILRFGGLFGYDRKPGNFIKFPKKIKNPDGYINLIYRDDCIQIIERIIKLDIWNEVFNACASDHPKRKDFYSQEILKTQGVKPQMEKNSENTYKIINSDKLKRILNYEFIIDKLIDS